MPLRKARKGSSAKTKRKVFKRAMHELKHSSRKRPLKQRLAIAFKAAGLSHRRKRARKK